MLIPLASPIGLGETNVMELTPETWNEVKDQDAYYREGIDGVIRLYVPSVIMTPALEVAAKTRTMFCFLCNQTKELTLTQIGGWNHYVCDKGHEQQYFVNRAPATRALG